MIEKDSGQFVHARPLVVLLNRWDDDFSRYDRYIDHVANRVVYLTNAAGKGAANPDLAEAVYEISSLEDFVGLSSLCVEITRQFGRIDRIVALSEYDLLSAAKLRDTFGVDGVSMARVSLYKDKVAMKTRLQTHGIRVPRFAALDQPEDAQVFVQEDRYPLILKPKMGAASRGVFQVLCRTELISLVKSLKIKDYECEEFIAGSVLHVDGVQFRDDPIFFKASKYINSCLAFNYGVPLASVMIDDSALRERILDLSCRILRLLDFHDGVFHLELLHSEQDELVFLELNARVGGGEIPFIIRDVYGVDLVAASMEIEMYGRMPRIESGSSEVMGWLQIPEPWPLPCRVTACRSLLGTIPHLYKEIIPAVGEAFDGYGGFEHISGRFYFRGPSGNAVEASIYEALKQFEIQTEAIPKPALPNPKSEEPCVAVGNRRTCVSS